MTNYDTSCFDSQKLSFDPTGYQCISFPLHHRLFELLRGYIASHVVDDFGSGFRMDVVRSKRTDDEEENPLEDTHYGRIVVKIGFGQYKFRTFDDEAYAVYQHIGEPVGGDCGPDIMQNLLIFTKSLPDFGRFLSKLLDLSEKPDEGKFVCFTWLIRHQYWREEVRVNNRPMASVVLPNAMKSRLVNDVEKFLSPKTKDFYLRNGIPYRRSYLFHGVPGTGKTSMVQALAGHFRRNVCFLMPTHPEMTDDNLREAIQSIPENSIVVLEDIDALFTKNRENKSNKSALTFSGLLNALDGIGSPHGQIFVLTTNLRENLDHALIRNGRVDMHLEFTYTNREQMELMWCNFYPEAKHLSEAFAIAVEKALQSKKLQITTSTLQHFFITQMEATPEEALNAVPSIVTEVTQNSSSSMLKASTTATSMVSEGKKKGKPGKKKREQERKRREREREAKGSSDSSVNKGEQNDMKDEFVVVSEAENGTTNVDNQSTEQKEKPKKRRSRTKKPSETNDEGNTKTESVVVVSVMEDLITVTSSPQPTGDSDDSNNKTGGTNNDHQNNDNNITPLPKRDRRNKNRSDSSEKASSASPSKAVVVEESEVMPETKVEEE